MSDELFEVAFSGQITDGADLEQVKAKVAAMFKADEAKLAHLFSGKRVVIKKNIDQVTANKYKTALNKAGAVCEVRSLSVVVKPAEQVEVQPQVASKPAVATAKTYDTGDVPAAPQTTPLGISANDISELAAGIAPVGSDMQEDIKEIAEPELDISGMDMAPAGSDLGEIKKDDDQPPPDTSGLSLVD